MIDLLFGARAPERSRNPGDQAGRERIRAGAPVSWLRAFPYLAGAAGWVCLAVTGALAVAGHLTRLWPAGWLGAGTSGLAADHLSGLFLLIAFSAAALVSVAFADRAARPGNVGRRGLGASYALPSVHGDRAPGARRRAGRGQRGARLRGLRGL